WTGTTSAPSGRSPSTGAGSPPNRPARSPIPTTRPTRTSKRFRRRGSSLPRRGSTPPVRSPSWSRSARTDETTRSATRAPDGGSCGVPGLPGGGLLDLAEHRSLGDRGTGLHGQVGDHAVLVRRDRGLHLHGLEDGDLVTGLDLLALLDGHLDGGALHRRGHGVARGGRTGGAAPGTGLGLAADRAAVVGSAEGEIARQGDLDAAAVHLDDDLLALDGLVVVGGGAGRRPRLDRVLPVGLDPLGVDVEALVVTDEGRVGDDVLVERDDRRHALHHVLVESACRTGERLVAVLAPRDELGQHRVELTADGVALLDAGVQPDARAGGLVVPRDGAGGREEVASRVLAVDAELERVTARGGVLGELEHLALGDLELLENQVDPGGLLGDRVLDLQAGVDLEEGDRVALHHELDGAGAVVAGLAADRLGRLVEPPALLVGEERGRGLLDELLEAALQSAVAGTGDDDVAVLVGEHLRLDVAGLVEVLLDKALAAAERGDGLTGGGLEEVGDLGHLVGDLHAAATA